MKFLDKFYNHADVPWVPLTWSALYSNSQTPPHAKSPVGSFWWKDVLKLFDKFQEFTICKPGKGNSVMLWSDPWSDQPLKDKFPQLFSFAKKPKCSIRFYLEQEVERILAYLNPPRLHPNYKMLRNWYKSRIGMMMLLTYGVTLGGLPSSVARKPTTYWLVTLQHLHSSNGFGLLAIWGNISFSFGSYLGTGLIQETCSEGRTDIMMTTIVLSAMMGTKRHAFIFSLNIPSVGIAS